MGLRARSLVLVAAFAALPTDGGQAAGEGPRALSGVLKIAYDMVPFNESPSVSVQSNNNGTFDATYHVHGTRRGKRGVAARQYFMSGTGTERLNFFRHDRKSSSDDTSDYTFSAKGSGTVTLALRGSTTAHHTSPLLLTLQPGGRFTLALRPLEGGGDDGVPLQFFIERDDTQTCQGGKGGTTHRIATYDSGAYLETSPQVCPDMDPVPNRHEGERYKQSIWGANIWSSNGQQPKVDVCHGRPGLLTNLTICGRYAHGRIRGRTIVGRPRSYILRGGCPFFPWGPGGLPNPISDPVGNQCDLLGLGTPTWRAILTFDWNFAPVK